MLRKWPFFALMALFMLSPIAVAVSLPQDDAGSGGDAPDDTVGAVEVEQGVVYSGLLVPLSDVTDVYSFRGMAGATVRLDVAGGAGCAAVIVTEEGAPLNAGCQPLGAVAGYDAILPANGTYYVVFRTFATAYRFAFALDGVPPDVLLPEGV